MKKIRFLYISSIITTSFLLMGIGPLVDPTEPPDIPAGMPTNTTPQQFNLQAVFLYPYNKIAIINNQSFKIGDKLGKYTVTLITINAVELEGPENSKEVLTLIPLVKHENN